jgi:hypothetical protein
VLFRAKQVAESLGNDHLRLFAEALEVNIRPITAVVHNAVASILGFPTVLIESTVPPARNQVTRVIQDCEGDPASSTEKPAAPTVEHAALKKRIQALERTNHNLRIESNNLTNQVGEYTAKQVRAEAKIRALTEERDDLKTLAGELEQARKTLKAELLEVRQKRETLAVEIRQEQSVDRQAPPVLPEATSFNRDPTPRPQGGQSASNRVSPPTLTVAERNEVERLAAALMATLVRLEGYKIRSADISSVTGIASGWKRPIEHLIGLGQVMHQGEFLCISDVEKLRRGLK